MPPTAHPSNSRHRHTGEGLRITPARLGQTPRAEPRRGDAEQPRSAFSTMARARGPGLLRAPPAPSAPHTAGCAPRSGSSAQEGDGGEGKGLPVAAPLHRGGEAARRTPRDVVPGQIPLSRDGEVVAEREGGEELFVRAALFPVTKFLLFYKLPQ